MNAINPHYPTFKLSRVIAAVSALRARILRQPSHERFERYRAGIGVVCR